MIYHYKMKQPIITGGSSGNNGTMQSPWYWSQKTQGSNTVAYVNNQDSEAQNAQVYIRVKLNAGTTYGINQHFIDGDSYLRIFNENGDYIQSNDDGGYEQLDSYLEFQPESTGIYIIGAGSYDGDSRGDIVITLETAPEEDTIPSSEISITYQTSEGFNDFGKAIKYKSASQCNLNKNLFPGAVWGYKNGNILNGLKSTATNNNVVADENGYFIFGNDKFFVLDKSLMNNSSPRTFVFQATLTASNGSIQFVDGGQDSSGCLFSLGWNYNSNQMVYHFSYDDNTNWYELQEGSYMIAFVYDGETLSLYVNGQLVDSSEHGLDTSGSNYYIGNYGPDSIYSMHGEWKSKFCIIYDRALEQSEIASFNKFA